MTLAALLSRVLLAYAVEFEADSEMSLAVCANVLRLVGDEGMRVRDLPHLSGVSIEAIGTALSFLEKHGYAVVKPESSGSRVKLLMLTAKGRKARGRYFELVESIEERWSVRFSKAAIRDLRESLERLAGNADGESSLLFRGSNLTLTGGGHRSRNQKCCRTFRWCCTAAVSPTAADPAVTAPNLSLESQFAQLLRAGAARDDARAALHCDLQVRGVVGLDRGHKFQIDDVRPVDSEEARAAQPLFEV